MKIIFVSLIIFALIRLPSFSNAYAQENIEELTPPPIDKIPKLPMFSKSVDYRRALTQEVLSPDAIIIDTVQVRTEMSVTAVNSEIGKAI